MSRYDEVWSNLIEGALETFDVSLSRFIRNAQTLGMSPSAIERRLIDDLTTEGPIFGPLQRSISGAATSSVLTAERQGEVMGRLQQLGQIADIDLDDIIDEADPGIMDDIERQELDETVHVWIAALKNTCHRCLPLHGKRLALFEWREKGLDPLTIHEGWNSPCYCKLVPTDIADTGETIEPILRTAIKGQKRTARNLMQRDIDKALAKRDEMLDDSVEARRVLRQLGQAQKEEKASKE